MRLWRHPSAARWEWRRLCTKFWREIDEGMFAVALDTCQDIFCTKAWNPHRHTTIRSLRGIIIWLELFKRLEWEVKWHANGTLCIDVRCLPKFYTLPPVLTTETVASKRTIASLRFFFFFSIKWIVISITSKASINRNHLTGNVRGNGQAEKGDKTCHFFRFTDST